MLKGIPLPIKCKQRRQAIEITFYHKISSLKIKHYDKAQINGFRRFDC